MTEYAIRNNDLFLDSLPRSPELIVIRDAVRAGKTIEDGFWNACELLATKIEEFGDLNTNITKEDGQTLVRSLETIVELRELLTQGHSNTITTHSQ